LYETGLAPYDTEKVSAELQAMGHVDVDIIPMWISKLTTIQVVRDGSGEVMLVGGVDQRSDGSIGGTNSNLSEPSISEAQSSDQDNIDASIGVQVTPFLFVGAHVFVVCATLIFI
jgi:hypothetical protein